MRIIISIFGFFLFISVRANALPGEPGDALTIFGPRPVYSNGAKPSVVFDDFGWFDSYIPENRKKQISAWIDEWEAGKISYAAYHGLGNIESEKAVAALGNSGRTMDLDGTYGGFNITRSAFKNYMIEAGKTAVDLGSEYIILDGAAVSLTTLSFDDEIIDQFRTYLYNNFDGQELAEMGVADISSFNYRAYLKTEAGGSYTSSESLNNNPPNDGLWKAWKKNIILVERQFFEDWTSEIRAYATNTYSANIYFGANRYMNARQWDLIDLFDVGVAETFLDDLGYPYYNLDHAYKNIRNFDKRFWSWNFPANTGKFNGSNDPWGDYHLTELSRVFLAECFAAGGIYQIANGWKEYLNSDARIDMIADDLRFARSHYELFNLDDDGEVAIVYNEAFEIEDTGGFTPGYRGIIMLLNDAHRSHDVIFAGHPSKRGGIDPFSSTDLSSYKAVILPNARMLTDSQVEKLNSYLNDGGIVIGFGRIADLDEDGEDKSASRTFDDHFASDGSTTVGAGKAISISQNIGNLYYSNAATNTSGNNWEVTSSNLSLLSEYQTTWSSAVDEFIDWDFESEGFSRLVHLYTYKDDDGSMVYHMVNKDINLTSDVDDQSMNDTAAVSCEIEIPTGFSESDVKLSWMTVESPTPVSLSFTETNGKATFTLPSFSNWGILKIGSSASQPLEIDETPEANFQFRGTGGTGGNRPDKVNEDEEIKENYLYWKGGNHGKAPFDIPFIASDDEQVESVKLYYRFAAKENEWGNWKEFSTTVASGKNVSGTISFSAPEGEGYYQMRIEAIDNEEQSEVVIERDETGYGFDETPPSPPLNLKEKTHQTGQWIEDPSSLVFTWDEATDNLSGAGGAYVFIGTDSMNVVDESLSRGTSSWAVDLSSLEEGERYKFVYRNEDLAGNWADSNTVFTFRYGSSPVLDRKNIVVTEGSEQLSVSWENPEDPNFSHVLLSFREYGDDYGNWVSGPISSGATTTSLDISGLEDDIPHEVLLTAISKNGKFGNEIKLAGTHTPSSTGPLYTLKAIVSGRGIIDISAYGNDSLLSLREKIHSGSGIPVSDAKIYLGSSELDTLKNAQSLQSLGFEDGYQFTVLENENSNAKSFANWQYTEFGDSKAKRLPSDDYNGDTVPNFVHYALGISGTANYDSDKLLQISYSSNSITIVYHKNNNASEAIVTVEASIDKGKTWNTLSSIGMNESVETVGEKQTASWSFSEGSYDDMLVRLSVSEDD